jgi:peptidoglycan/LPS O-acetylase OafA/YrhL
MTLVFFGHFEGLFRRYLPAGGASLRLIEFLAVIGHQGVCFFLVLSGYFVYKSYLDNPGGYANFAFRRVRRIYPPYVVMCGLYIVLSFLFPTESKIPPGSSAILYLAGNLLMVSSRPMLTVSWTIGTLLALNTVVPPFWKAVRYELWKPAYRIAFILATVALWYSIPKSVPMLDGRAAFVLVGFALYEAMNAGAAFEAGGELPGLAILGCGYLLWYAADRGWTCFLRLPESWSHYLFLAPGLFYACGYVIRGRGRLASWLERTGMPRLGRISYAYYLCHGLVLKALQLLLVTLRPEAAPSLTLFWAGLPIAYGCTLIAGWGWFRLVEVRLDAARFQDGRAVGKSVWDGHLPDSHAIGFLGGVKDLMSAVMPTRGAGRCGVPQPHLVFGARIKPLGGSGPIRP